MTDYTPVDARALVDSAIKQMLRPPVTFYPYIWSIYHHPNGLWLEVANSRTGAANSFLLDEEELNDLERLVNYIAWKAVALRDNLNATEEVNSYAGY